MSKWGSRFRRVSAVALIGAVAFSGGAGVGQAATSAAAQNEANLAIELPLVISVLPQVNGTPRVGVELTLTRGIFVPLATNFSYQWRLDNVAVPNATGQTFIVPEDAVGKRVSVTVVGSLLGFLPTAATSLQTGPVTPGAFDTAVPTVSGPAVVGGTLSTTVGPWSPVATNYTYQWRADGAIIAGATGKTYTPGASRAGKRISVTVTGTRTGYTTSSATSVGTVPLGLGSISTVTPKITGTPKVGGHVTVTVGTWAPKASAYSYQWLVDGKVIAGATAKTYRPTFGAAGKRLSVRVTGTLSGYQSASATSALTVPVARGTFGTAVPKISGTAKVGSTLTVTVGVWTPKASVYTYQWYAGGQPIAGATGKTYRPTTGAVGKRITVKVTGSLAGYATTSVSSASTATVTR